MAFRVEAALEVVETGESVAIKKVFQAPCVYT